MSGNTGEIIALIPAYNEVAYITDVVKGVLKYVPAVVVDDGSTDKSGAAAALAGAKVLVHTVNQGKGRALNTGFDYAVERGVDAAITIDADGQHDPDEIPLFIEAYRAGVGDLIIGQRDFSQMPSKNQFGNRTGTWLLGMAMGRPIPDNQSGYRLHSRGVMRTVPRLSLPLRARIWSDTGSRSSRSVSAKKPCSRTKTSCRMAKHASRQGPDCVTSQTRPPPCPALARSRTIASSKSGRAEQARHRTHPAWALLQPRPRSARTSATSS